MRKFKPIDIIGAVLIVALVITAIRLVGDALVGGHEEAPAVAEATGEAEMAAEDAAPETAAEEEAMAEAEPEAAPAEEPEAAGGDIAALVAEADPAAGEKLFKSHLCAGCHKFEPGQHGAGPSLAGVYGSDAGQAEGFTYSGALKDSGIVWTAENLDVWVAGPKDLVPGTKMILPKPVKDPQDRADLIAYLKQETSP